MKPYYEAKEGVLYCENCLEILRNLPDNSADLLFTDPPYNADKPYDIYKDNLTPHDYINILTQVIGEGQRITGNRLCLFVGYKILKLAWDLVPDARLVIIHKRAIGSYDKYYFHQYFGLLTTVKPYLRTYDLWEDVRLPGEGYFFKEKRPNHPAYTGKALTKKVIDLYSKEGDTVLDPFAGTGTTAVACKELNRKWICIELSQGYCEIAKKRLERVDGQQQRLLG